MLSHIGPLRNQRIIELYNAIILCQSWQRGEIVLQSGDYKHLSGSSLWAFSLASLQSILLIVATENIFLLLSLFPAALRITSKPSVAKAYPVLCRP